MYVNLLLCHLSSARLYVLSLYMLASRHKPHKPFVTTLFREILLLVVRRRAQLSDKVFMQVCEKKVKVKRDLG